MDIKNKFQAIISKALARVTDEHGELVDPDQLPVEQQSDDLWIAWALISAAGAGPFTAQKARIEAWAGEREERFIKARDTLERFGIGVRSRSQVRQRRSPCLRGCGRPEPSTYRASRSTPMIRTAGHSGLARVTRSGRWTLP